MVNKIETPSLTQFSARFGMKALDMGFVTIDQVLEALTEQTMENYINKHHRPLGRIFLEKGWMTLDEVNIVLKSLKTKRKDKGLFT